MAGQGIGDDGGVFMRLSYDLIVLRCYCTAIVPCHVTCEKITRTS